MSPGLRAPVPCISRAARITGKRMVTRAEVQKRQHPELGSPAGLETVWGLAPCSLVTQAKAEGVHEGPWAMSWNLGSVRDSAARVTSLKQGGGAYKYRCARGVWNQLCFAVMLSSEGSLA